MTKYIFVTGGVVSSVGKGITSASIGRLLKSRGLNVSVLKLDPYLNVDPGTMSPYQHGEVFVTEDGAETDLDLGHYERFIDINLTRASNTTSGQVYSAVIARERKGDYLGGTIQVVPHVTNEIKDRIHHSAKQSGADILIVEVGGTVGDIEGQPFLEAIRQMRKDAGRDNVLYIHVTLLPYIPSTGELKTKPTQHSVAALRAIGIQPDVLVCRSDNPVSEDIRLKLSDSCDVEREAVVPLETVQNIYEVPLILEQFGLREYIWKRLSLPEGPDNLDEWRELVGRMTRPKDRLRVAIVGKYIQLQDAYLSVREALRHAALHHEVDLDIAWVDAELFETEPAEALLEGVSGIVVPGGFGYRGIEGKMRAARYARHTGLPYLGLCLGMQVIAVDLAREVIGSDEPNSAEFSPNTSYPIFDLLPEQRESTRKGGTMRLGSYPVYFLPNSLAGRAYGDMVAYERHRHRYEFNNDYRDLLVQNGLIISGYSPDGRLVELLEIAGHPWMVGSQFHPEFKSRPNRPHPLFRDFIGAAKQHSLEAQRNELARPATSAERVR